jgi:hypothetical protein
MIAETVPEAAITTRNWLVRSDHREDSTAVAAIVGRKARMCPGALADGGWHAARTSPAAHSDIKSSNRHIGSVFAVLDSRFATATPEMRISRVSELYQVVCKMPKDVSLEYGNANKIATKNNKAQSQAE